MFHFGRRRAVRKLKATGEGLPCCRLARSCSLELWPLVLGVFFDGHLGHHQFGFRQGKGVDDALQVTRRLVEEVATSRDASAGVELFFHDIEEAYPRVCRTVLWALLERLGCDLSLLKVLKMLHGGTSYQVRVHGGLSESFVMERGLREGCPYSPVFF